jgi:dipeptidyl aminopeptidase/acylaminoacyl peptidase
MTRPRAGLALVALVVAALATAAPAQATFPGRNGAIGFVQYGSSGGPGTIYDTHGLYRAPARRHADARALVQCKLTDFVPQNCTITDFFSPSWSPDGRRLVFDAGAQLAVVNADGSGLRLLSAVTSNDNEPAFAPDGRRIVFTGTNDDGGTDVYVRRLAAGSAHAIVPGASEPAWSSLNEIAYVSDAKIYRADPSGGHRRLVTAGISPDWSPDGKRLVLIRPARPGALFGRIHAVGRRGHGLQAIGKRKDIADPVWSPDGRWLAFHGFELGVHTRRFLPHARTFEIAQTQTGSEGGYVSSFDPAWQPR